MKKRALAVEKEAETETETKAEANADHPGDRCSAERSKALSYLDKRHPDKRQPDNHEPRSREVEFLDWRERLANASGPSVRGAIDRRSACVHEALPWDRCRAVSTARARRVRPGRGWSPKAYFGDPSWKVRAYCADLPPCVNPSFPSASHFSVPVDARSLLCRCPLVQEFRWYKTVRGWNEGPSVPHFFPPQESP